MDIEDRLEELLVEWQLLRQQGKELSAKELCVENPELVQPLARMISQLREMQWLEESDDTAEVIPLSRDTWPDSSGVAKSESANSQLGIDTFLQRLVDSGVMSSEKAALLRVESEATDSNSFAEQLVIAGELTVFQAKVLLEDRRVPLQLDRYLILEEIGRGGMGTVYKALHRQMDRIVALKILPKEKVDSPQKVRRFQREVKTAAKLDHPNIVTAFDATESNGTHFLVMSLVDGQNLAEYVRRHGPVSCSDAVNFILQAASGLDYAHALGVIHRDIKPANLLLNTEGKIKILDMGLARIHERQENSLHADSTELTEDGAVLGTVSYLAPEQALDTRKADERSDVYALGCTLHYLLTGKPPYKEDTLVKTLLAHREAEIPSLRIRREDVPEKLDTIFQMMVAKQPESRFQTMRQLITALQDLCLDTNNENAGAPAILGAGSDSSWNSQPTLESIRTPKESGVPTSEGGSFRVGGRRWLWGLGAALGLLAVAAGLVIQWKTPAGLVILELDQPEMIGAVVRIDGDEMLTIETAEGLKPIRITPDAERHLLEIETAGFKTFSQSFSFETGNTQRIQVRLEPLEETPRESLPPENRTSADPQPAPAIAPFTAEEARQFQEAWAKYLGIPVEFRNSIGMKLAVIPAGAFAMGSSEEEIQELISELKSQGWEDNALKRFMYEGPQHRAEFTHPWMLGVYEVTRGQFRQFVNATNYITDAERDGYGGGGWEAGQRVRRSHFSWKSNHGFETELTDDHPVVNVSWNDATAFCAWLSELDGANYRLPTEAEWEFACRAGSQSQYSIGDDLNALAEYAWYGAQGERGTRTVGMNKPNAFGLFDLQGNVCEWCNDWYGPYESRTLLNPTGLQSGQLRVLRGGAYTDTPSWLRCANRHHGLPYQRSSATGFRVVKTIQVE